jgi:uncharacterized protein (DUF1330 family)
VPAYFIADIEVTDPADYADYGKHVDASLTPYQGRFLVRGGALESLEGGWAMQRVVVLEFPSMAQAKAWYRSDGYKDLLVQRLRSTRSKAVLVEGV